MRLTSWIAILVMPLCGCEPRPSTEFCDPDHGLSFELPAGWEAEPRRESQNSIIQLRNAEAEGIRDFAVTISPSTPDAKNLGSAANRLGFALSMGNHAGRHEPLDLLHPEYDSSAATTATGSEVTHNVWMVLDDLGGPQVLVHMVAAETRPEDVAALRSLVESVRYTEEGCP